MQKWKTWLQHPLFLWVLFGLAAIAITLRNLFLPQGNLFAPGDHYTHYNNFIIFRNAFWHLLHGETLYFEYPAEQFDLFKYSPSFALLFAPFAALPVWLGLALWNILNAWVLVLAIRKLPLLNYWQKAGFGLLLLQELITSTINSQCNALIVALLLLALAGLEKGKIWLPVILIWLTVFIKIFGILFFAMVLLYPQRWKTILPALLVFAALLALPLPVTGLQGLSEQYAAYFHLLAGDHGQFVKYSVMGWLQSWFHLQPPKNYIVVGGLLLQLLPLLFWRRFDYPFFRTLYAASWCIWLVIFNHMAESATFVIAVAGVLLWYFAQPIRKNWHILLLLPVILFTCFGPSDLYPRALRHLIVEQWQLKVFPCIVVWCVCLWQVFRYNKSVTLQGQ
ncbi:MAG: DUF2029 domain-containing protein [Bacteroidetes bacterium]|nr:DUF2029 domain-containing protein [Bacteroidota bacterium]